MSKIKNWAMTMVARDEEGQGLGEYGLILALVAVACVGALTTFSGAVQSLLGGLAGNI